MAAHRAVLIRASGGALGGRKGPRQALVMGTGVQTVRRSDWTERPSVLDSFLSVMAPLKFRIRRLPSGMSRPRSYPNYRPSPKQRRFRGSRSRLRTRFQRNRTQYLTNRNSFPLVRILPFGPSSRTRTGTTYATDVCSAVGTVTGSKTPGLRRVGSLSRGG